MTKADHTMFATMTVAWIFAEARRAAEIATLPTVEWKGQRLHTLRCHGDFGKGPHDVNLPEMWLWALIGLEHFRCPYHR